MSSELKNAKTAGLFITCLGDLFRPGLGFAAIELIEKAGCEVSVPVQSCCGQPAYNSGEDEMAATLAKNVIRDFEQFDYVVVPSGSCAAMIKIHYPQLLKDDPDWEIRAQKLAAITYELSEFLVDVMEINLDFDGSCTLRESVVTYHDSCSGLRELGIRGQPRKLLRNGAGIKISEMDNSEICCGFGGTFCMKFPEISTRMVDNKIEGAINTDADIVLGGDLGCLMNIAGRLGRKGKPIKVYHYAELLVDNPSLKGIAQGDQDQ